MTRITRPPATVAPGHGSRARRPSGQRVTVHRPEEVVIITAEEYGWPRSSLTGEALIEAMLSSPGRNIDTIHERADARAQGVVVTGWLLDTNVPFALRRRRRS